MRAISARLYIILLSGLFLLAAAAFFGIAFMEPPLTTREIVKMLPNESFFK